MKGIFDLVKKVFSDWSEDRAPRLGAALAYYAVFSLAPLLVLLIGIAGLVFGQEAVQSRVMAQVGGILGEQGGSAIGEMIQGARKPSTGIIATVIGLVTLLFGASGVFGQLHDALNTIWEVQPKPGRGILGMIRDRFVSFTMILGVGFLLMISLVVSAGMSAFGEVLGGFLPGPEILLQAINLVVSLAVITVLFALIFKVLPDAEIAWGDVWIGAFVTALLFTIGKFALGLYLGKSDVASSYGAAGSLIIILLWIYYSSQILFLGAEFTQVYANTYGSRVVPAEDAVPVTEEARAQQGMPSKETVESAASGLAPAASGSAPAPSASAPTTTRSPQRAAAAPIATVGPAVPVTPAATTSPEERQSKLRAYGVAAGVGWIALVVGVFLGAIGSIVGALVGVLRRARA
ncbi:MAG: Inner membrane protein YihY, formerly thought to be RNase BN [uncultured Chloroflexia bacterium]|uniref:Inner membrane protein YihY, formerly thought to be RNase BN n=1 Tax=uncultured Chloroflexia bacterium TaxID=1672391 RepID=A0A6J4HUH3_9CHLR|nr:MAG: Inner membrane protein YihY, formerly thought to be RNase BN [uncultured Chloroflexia bacterium]